MKGILKTTLGAFAFSVILAGLSKDIYAGAGIYVGKDVSAEGTALVGVSTEANIGVAMVAETVKKGSLHKGDVIELDNGFKYTLPEDIAGMTVWRTMSYGNVADSDSVAANEYGVSVLAALTKFSNPDAVAADPFVADGICEEKLSRIVASTAKNAKDAVKTLCTIYEEKGAEAPEIVFISDPDGVWVVENYTGHQYVAVKLPDDAIATFSNENVIQTVDPDDKNTVCSKELFSLPEEKGFAVYDKNKNIDLSQTYMDGDTYIDETHTRVWVGHDIFAPSAELRYDSKEEYDTFFAPDEKVSIKEAFEFFRNRFEGTMFDLSDDENKAELRGINNQLVSAVQMIQVFDDVPKELSTVVWSTPANPTASPFIAIPAYADSLPDIYTKDITPDSSLDGVMAFDFIKLNNGVLPRRETYGRSIRQYWHGMECVAADDVARLVRGEWKDAFDEDPAEAADKMNGYIDEIVRSADEDALRLSEEFEWYLFRNGVTSLRVPDDQLMPFECSFDAVAYAGENGWETKIEGDVFTATKDGKTIEVVFAGADKGNVTFTGFDRKALMEDFGTDDADEVEETTEEVTVTVTEEPEVKEEDTKEEDTKETVDVVVEEVEEETAEKSAKIDGRKAEEIGEAAADKIEVDTIAALNEYFEEKIAALPKDGWSEREAKSQLSAISRDVSGIIGKYFNIKVENFFDLITLDQQIDPEGAKKSKELEDIRKRLSATGDDIAGLVTNYFNATYEDVLQDLASGRLTQQGAEKILREAQGDIEGVIRLYINGGFGEVFNTDLTEEELAGILKDLGESTVKAIEDYTGVDPGNLDIGGISLDELTDADVNVVITLNEMDDDVINGLSEILGVDVRDRLDEYVKEIRNVVPDKITFTEEKHDQEEANTALDPETEAMIELQETLSGDDVEVPQEVIDILNDAINEAGEASNEAETPTKDKAADNRGSSFTINIGNIEKNGQKVLLPAFMLQYFN